MAERKAQIQLEWLSGPGDPPHGGRRKNAARVHNKVILGTLCLFLVAHNPVDDLSISATGYSRANAAGLNVINK